jgi:hypothetical protein
LKAASAAITAIEGVFAVLFADGKHLQRKLLAKQATS